MVLLLEEQCCFVWSASALCTQQHTSWLNKLIGMEIRSVRVV